MAQSWNGQARHTISILVNKFHKTGSVLDDYSVRIRDCTKFMLKRCHVDVVTARFWVRISGRDAKAWRQAII